ncbi:rhs element Vgr protein [Paludibacterium purpuratum]|uniref:Phage protein D n=1 Tax=Paludibacterium purpuratum TaxID=1144873 RepID=A0A4R7B5V2_9NEIS|nr:rhs element Vgr protein [Paludibacterium purpuratum]TDR79998.1 hypothetical protein DFP86_106138 [Paludibacterium purpuratum]
MILNDPQQTANARAVAGRLRLNGKAVPFASLDIEASGGFSADTFSAVLPLSCLPKDMGLTDWWAKQQQIGVSIDIGVEGPSGVAWQSMLVGQIDHWRYQPARFDIEISGRDLTARFLDNKTSEKFANRTTSDVATLLAQRRGLKPVVTATKTQVGGIYKHDQNHVSSDSCEWDLLTYFAGMDGFRVYVLGEELHYEPAPDPAKADQYVIRYRPPDEALAYPQGNVGDDLLFERDMTLARGVKVHVQSWLNGKGVEASWPPDAASDAQLYKVVRSSLDVQRAKALAKTLYEQIAVREVSMQCSLPGDNLLTPGCMVRVQGTGAGFDQLYYVEHVKRSLSVDNGYVMTLSATNRNPANKETT